MPASLRLAAVLVFAFVSAALPLHAALDSTLYTNYSLAPGRTRVDWVVCGSLPFTSGCYGSGTLGPFGKIGGMLEGYPAFNLSKGTVTRFIYVLDVAGGLHGD